MLNQYKSLVLCFFLAPLFFSCGGGSDSEPEPIVDSELIGFWYVQHEFSFQRADVIIEIQANGNVKDYVCGIDGFELAEIDNPGVIMGNQLELIDPEGRFVRNHIYSVNEEGNLVVDATVTISDGRVFNNESVLSTTNEPTPSQECFADYLVEVIDFNPKQVVLEETTEVVVEVEYKVNIDANRKPDFIWFQIDSTAQIDTLDTTDLPSGIVYSETFSLPVTPELSDGDTLQFDIQMGFRNENGSTRITLASETIDVVTQ